MKAEKPIRLTINGWQFEQVRYMHGWSPERVQTEQRRKAKAFGFPVQFRFELEDASAGPVMVFIPSGRFLMGDLQHKVEVAGFLIGKYPVSFEEYDRFCDATRRAKPDDYGFGRGTLPVVDISWSDAVAYCEWLALQSGAPCCRLPTSAEWEYACRAGSATRYNCGADESALDDHAWYIGNSDGRPHPVGEKQANAWGLHDMAGNVWEWGWDWYGEGSEDKVILGGGWRDSAMSCSVAVRNGKRPASKERDLGFRVIAPLLFSTKDFCINT